ncbi:hypothetical protein IMZ11_24650 [Microtetraspora sp. AC03309]|nr:hypothetical protein [Microtetraspora sp. AC03309]MCC5578821.1 hypothetical protein [Microtetraspora sp. AC03309]
MQLDITTLDMLPVEEEVSLAPCRLTCGATCVDDWARTSGTTGGPTW